MTKRIGLLFLKLIGIALFVLILIQIDRQQLLEQLRKTDLWLLGTGFTLIFLIYYCKAKRFEVLVHATGIRLSAAKHWRIFNIGIFLASITPGKLGEMGRAAYLKAAGVQTVVAVAITVLDRIIDMLLIGMIAVVGAGILFGWAWLMIGSCVFIIAMLILWLFRHRMHAVIKHIRRDIATPVILWTCAAWAAYFVSTIIIARSVGIDTPVPVLVAVLTFSGILSLLPIAPSGLGTRDATFVILLAPYGVEAEKAVAFALLMFISIILSGFLGGWYWMKGVR